MDDNFKINIRKTEYLDIPLILRFIEELAECENLKHKVNITEEVLKKSLFGKKPYAKALIVEVNFEPVGFVLFFYTFSTFLGKPGIYIEDLFIKEEFRGLGIGRKIFEYISNIAFEKNCNKIEWQVLKWNPAREFYEKIGANPVDEWVNYQLNTDKIVELSKNHIKRLEKLK
ncbi:GCN5-related N-acetyltransferase [Methanococcus vannielii SB]|uniref:GCN5-related N-acetyltransferase n=1 Tax=Methanococcus vannielii (strain ATCC 35089 / DSM 1224 / JCM 13029 / OCM 148 / SB) TaxID=406327 RepID=A6UPS5_METVS|nr:GNAT family N-acetyltransferase [Methanococcus vannielii]ABR54497.1 GCN5-related N-acetyltransferase [Methanococcus vannielii SB]